MRHKPFHLISMAIDTVLEACCIVEPEERLLVHTVITLLYMSPLGNSMWSDPAAVTPRTYGHTDVQAKYAAELHVDMHHATFSRVFEAEYVAIYVRQSQSQSG